MLVTTREQEKKLKAAPPRDRDTSRPFRLWNAKRKEAMRWRYYKEVRNAHLGALIECRFTKEVGTCIEVYNIRTGKLMGQYTRTVNTIEFLGE